MARRILFDVFACYVTWTGDDITWTSVPWIHPSQNGTALGALAACKDCSLIRSGRLTSSQIAESAECDRRTVSTIRKNLRLFGTPGTPSVHIDCQPAVTPYMTDVLLDHPNEQPGPYLEEMVGYLHYQFGAWVSKYSVQRALTHRGWAKKQMRRKAQEQNPRLRVFYNTNYLNSTLISYSFLMSLDVINEWDIGGLAGPRLELPRSKYQNFRGASAIIYCQHMPRTALFCLVSIVAQLMLPFSKIFWNNFFGIVGGSQHVIRLGKRKHMSLNGKLKAHPTVSTL